MLMYEYKSQIFDTLNEISHTQSGKIMEAAQKAKEVMKHDGLIYVFGCGHSGILSEEVFYRAGGLGCVAPIFFPPLMLHVSASKSSKLEKQPGLAQQVIEEYKFTQRDMFFCISTSGINAVPIEVTETVRSQGVFTVAICSSAYFDKSVSSRSGRHLYEAADIWIDNMVPYGDACLQPKGSRVNTTPLSTIMSTFIINSILAESIEIAIAEGIDVPIYLSGNVPGGSEENVKLINRYSSRIKSL
jgi:uncharacterized phosphosugar-binding protein